MAMTLANSLFLDTNVLLDATVPARPWHAHATELFRRLPPVTSLCVRGQILREYLGVCTRPRANNGLGLSVEDTLKNVEAFLRVAVSLEETSAVNEKWRRLVAQYQVSGKQVHDANIVATAVTHGVNHIVTSNLADFKRYEDVITLLNPEQVDENFP